MTLSVSLVVPVKRLAVAKTRLAGLASQTRQEMALAFAHDTVLAALSCAAVGAVVVVTDEPLAASSLGTLGATVVPDVPDAGLNAALEYGARRAVAIHPHDGVAAVSADLPAIRPDKLGRALNQAMTWASAFVADASGAGTTVVTASGLTDFAPGFGADSRARHLAAGMGEVDLADIPTVRCDVDTEDDLREALRLGVGPHTRSVVARLGWR